MKLISSLIRFPEDADLFERLGIVSIKSDVKMDASAFFESFILFAVIILQTIETAIEALLTDTCKAAALSSFVALLPFSVSSYMGSPVLHCPTIQFE